MYVVVIYATAAIQDAVEVELSASATVADAITRSGLVETWKIDTNALVVAIRGRRVAAHAPLAEGYRVELTRRLEVDPKDARRRRAAIRQETDARIERKRGS